MSADVISLNAAITGCIKGGQWPQALALLHKMREACMTADVISFNAVITGCNKGDKPRFFSLRMREAGMPADLISFNAAISACEKGGQLKSALLLLRKMRGPGMTARAISVGQWSSGAVEGSGRRLWRCSTKWESWHDCWCDQLQCDHLRLQQGSSAPQDARSWHECTCDQLQCGHLSVREGMAVEVGLAAASQDACAWHDCQSGQHRAVVHRAIRTTCEKGMQWEQSVALLYKMREAGMTAKVISFSTIS